MMLGMADYSTAALGRVVRRLRNGQGLSQEKLGRDAKYQTGAGVSISRLEHGLLRPGPAQFEGIARTLGITPEELEAEAATETSNDSAHTSAGAGEPDGAARRTSQGGAALPGLEGLKGRVKRIHAEIDARAKAIEEATEAFNEQHDRARDEFFMRFVAFAERLEGAPPPDAMQIHDGDETDADAVAAYRFETTSNLVAQLLAGGVGGAAAGAAVGGAAAYGTFVAVAALGTASTGASIAGLSGVAATNATLALLGGGTLAAGGAGVAGGTMVLAGIVAAPIAILAAGGLVWVAKRNRMQQRELAAKLDEAEAEPRRHKRRRLGARGHPPAGCGDPQLYRDPRRPRPHPLGGSVRAEADDLGSTE